jgi:Xaa-Pro dipeptidase
LNEDRLHRFQDILTDAGLDCYLACTPISMGYLAGFFEGGGERMLVMAIRPSGPPAMIVPSLSATHAAATGISDIRTWSDGEDPGLVFEQLANDWGLKAAIIGVDDEMPAGYLLRMQSALPAALFKCAGDDMAALRKLKSGAELTLMRRAADIADRALPMAMSRIAPGVREAEVAKALLDSMSAGGGTPTFCIVAAGASGAEPHHTTSEAHIKDGDVVVMDWGCQVENYLSDITRTVCCGRASDEAKKVYRIVYDAHMAARAAIRPGVSCEEVDRAAREVIERAGYGEFFVHRTGHGIGMMGHEPPHIVRGSTSPLEVGQCFSVEPGIYLPGKFGVRIENIVTVTEDGHESLNEDPSPELIELGV